MLGTFPDKPVFTGFNEPRRIQAEVDDLVVTGRIPDGLDGALYRNGPDPRYPPLLGDDVNWNGDGMVSMWRFNSGHVDFRCRYVRTEKFLLEREARRALFGAYRNPFTDDDSVRGRDRTTANTAVYAHAGSLFAVKEDGLPYRLNPVTLETIGRHDWNGRVQSQTSTAHPKFDPVTGQMLAIGYEASGPATLDVSIQQVAANGILTAEQLFYLPRVAFIHDWGVTQDYFIVPVMPTTTSLDWLRSGGGFRWTHCPEGETLFAVLPRNGSATEIRWFRGPASGGGGHFLNAYNTGRTLVLDGFYSRDAQFPYVTNTDGTPFDRGRSTPVLARWTFDMNSTDDRFTLGILFPDDFMEMPVVDPRFSTLRHSRGFGVILDQTKMPNVQGTLGLGWNTLAAFDVDARTMQRWYVGDKTTCQEPVFVPRHATAPEGDGWLLSVLTRDTGDGIVTELVVLDTARLLDGPVATIHMPFRLHAQTHGTWVSEADLSQMRI